MIIILWFRSQSSKKVKLSFQQKNVIFWKINFSAFGSLLIAHFKKFCDINLCIFPFTISIYLQKCLFLEYTFRGNGQIYIFKQNVFVIFLLVEFWENQCDLFCCYKNACFWNIHLGEMVKFIFSSKTSLWYFCWLSFEKTSVTFFAVTKY